MIYHQAELLCRNLEQAFDTGEILRTYTTYVALTTDAVCQYIFGKSLGYLVDRSAAYEWSRTTSALPRVTPLIKQFPWVVALALRTPSVILHTIVPHLAQVIDLHKVE